MKQRNNNLAIPNTKQHTRIALISLLGSLILILALAACQQQDAMEVSETPAPGARSEAALPTVKPTAEAIKPTSTTEVPAATTETPTETAQPENEMTPTEETAPTASTTSTPVPTQVTLEPPEGALIAVSMESQVGVLLDEIPEDIRDRAIEVLLEKPEAFWIELAERQVRLTKRRLNFRNFVYGGKGQLPLPPEELWLINVDRDSLERQTVDGHDLLLAPYTFTSTLLSDAQSPGEAEPQLGAVGGQWDEPFILPLDPDQLLQRTGNACVNEAGFPPNSFDSVNAWVFYDYTCEGDSGGVLGCHRTRLNAQSCLEALADRVGTVDTAVRFERLEWDPNLANEVRVGELTHVDSPDLKVVGDDLENYRLIYRYFPEESCALLEQCVNDSGWRRLLQFNATVHNVGAETMYIGPVVAENPINNLFQYNACHAHYHFSDYGDFYFAGQEENISSKQAFCVESTNRFSNNEWSPLTHDYTCRMQGVQAGWVDEYVAGLDCQWIDVTDLAIDEDGSLFSLGFTSNPDQFLCEGSLVRDEDDNLVWEPSGLEDINGNPINRPQCEFVPDWDINNDDFREIMLGPSGSFVTEPCASDELGPFRDCGFITQFEGIEPAPTPSPAPQSRATSTPTTEQEIPPGAFICQPGQTVQLACSVEDAEAPQTLRICEYSVGLETGVACVYREALANRVIGSEEREVTFTCPFTRDVDEPGGYYSLYTAPLLPQDSSQIVQCRVQ